MRRSRYICAATQKGSINILDPSDFQVVKVWNAHSSLIQDMDAQNDFVVSCGCQFRGQGQSYILDVMVNVFDLKNMIALSPIPFPAGAAHLRMHPRMSTTVIVLSQHGQMHVVDLMNPNTSNIKQISGTHISMIDIAPSGEALVLADAENQIHLWGSPSRIRFGDVSNPVEFAEPEETHIELDWSPNT